MGTVYYWLGLIVFWWWVLRLLERVLILPILNGFLRAHEEAKRGYIPPAKPRKPKPAPQPGLFFELLRGKR